MRVVVQEDGSIAATTLVSRKACNHQEHLLLADDCTTTAVSATRICVLVAYCRTQPNHNARQPQHIYFLIARW